jgi:hypothetical protein
VRINEELLERKLAAPVSKTEINYRRGSAALTTRHHSTHKSWHKFLHELEVILRTDNIDICLISETHFTEESFIRFMNYITYRIIHSTPDEVHDFYQFT